ncbi:MAG: TIGR03032 family protein [Paracoccaceae bacterium]
MSDQDVSDAAGPSRGGGKGDDATGAPPRLEFSGSRLFTSWLASRRASLAFTTYQAGKVFFVGLQPDGRLSVFERSFPRCMGMGRMGDGSLWLASLYQLLRFENFLEPGERREGHDAVYVPVAAHTTGDIDVHDIHPDAQDRPVFAATRFNCLATLSERGSFTPLWRPPFVDRLAAEDRCHLNGFCMRNGAPAYATCVGRSNVVEGWRESRRDGGLVIDVASGEVVAEGLSMPHSPRLHDGRLWLIQSGTGEFGHVDLATGRFEPVCFLPGFARGVAFAGEHAVVGVSRPREDRTFSGLALEERLAREGVGPRCELAIVNLSTGDVEHRLHIEGVVQELYDVAVLPGVARPMALGFRTDEIRFMVKPTMKT